jgi:hypothetical protein
LHGSPELKPENGFRAVLRSAAIDELSPRQSLKSLASENTANRRQPIVQLQFLVNVSRSKLKHLMRCFPSRNKMSIYDVLENLIRQSHKSLL